MKKFSEFPQDRARALQYILFDIDDTITNMGKLLPAAYQALWDLHNAGFTVIPVTGRPAGWCDMIIRQWPVDAVIGENGAFCYVQGNNGFTKITHPNAGAQGKLEAVREACLRGVPGCRVAKDQFSRLYDLAIDFNEDEPRLGLAAAYEIQAICQSYGAQAKVSSIHVNAWFGEYDKVSMAKLLFAQVYGGTMGDSLFLGDSPNDEPMFAHFQNSCAVANIRPFLDKLTHKPAYITHGEGGYGFAEAAGQIISARSLL
jgi:HAD superfamily hydrolase (TIGR01484 family)